MAEEGRSKETTRILPPPVHHVVVDPVSLVRCQRCGVHQGLSLPCRAVQVVEELQTFIRQHHACQQPGS